MHNFNEITFQAICSAFRSIMVAFGVKNSEMNLEDMIRIRQKKVNEFFQEKN